MTITTIQFRIDFPEFQDMATYPESSLDFWLGVAVISLPANRWGAFLDVGTELFTAHHLVLSAQAAEDASVGNTPGEVTGPTASKSVDKVSVGYDTGSVALDNAGFWNLSVYGIQFLQMARMVGSGGMQFGGC